VQLWKACKDGNLEDVQAVVNNNTPQDQRAALLKAEEFSSVRLCLILRQAILSTDCLQPWTLDQWGNGVHRAAYNGHTAIVSYLIEMGAEVDVQNRVGGCMSMLEQAKACWMLVSGLV
jgi:hypothetical protein